MTPLEKLWLEQGMEKGMQQGESELLMFQLLEKFNTVPESYRLRIAKAEPKTLLTWGIRLLHCNSLEEIFKD